MPCGISNFDFVKPLFKDWGGRGIKMPPLLNTKYEHYCLARYEGKSKRQSAIIAGYSKLSCGITAHKLETLPEVQARIRELLALDGGATIAGKHERQEVLTNIIRHKPMPEKVAAKERIWAVSELNKMDGAYPPEKHAFLGDIVIEVIYADRDKRKDQSASGVTNPALPPS